MMNFQRTIARRRDRIEHSEQELIELANGASNGSVPDYQLAAWLMAAYLNPLSVQETAWLTLAMANSGQRMDLSGLPKPWVDKHSTGGVGDKTTLVLLPLLAACGLTMVKMSGRGLGITGGTVDKLAAIPGFRLDLSPEQMKAQAAEIGLALTGQTPSLAPADKALYALRDVTETVSSIPLIVSSILSKKIAGGAETVVLDVKCGSGAFMKTVEEATALAQALAETGRAAGLNIRLAVTDMDQPLGQCVGNALEVREALDVLENLPLSPSSLRFRNLCIDLANATLSAAGFPEVAEATIASGRAAEKARLWIGAQGGPSSLVEVRDALQTAKVIKEITAAQAGFVHTIHAETVGRAVVNLGGGRHKKDDELDLSVGVELFAPVGTSVLKGQVYARIHARTESEVNLAAEAIAASVSFSSDSIEAPPLVLAHF